MYLFVTYLIYKTKFLPLTFCLLCFKTSKARLTIAIRLVGNVENSKHIAKNYL